jgi:fibronectin-binding autotransporter adhesin
MSITLDGSTEGNVSLDNESSATFATTIVTDLYLPTHPSSVLRTDVAGLVGGLSLTPLKRVRTTTSGEDLEVKDLDAAEIVSGTLDKDRLPSTFNGPLTVQGATNTLAMIAVRSAMGDYGRCEMGTSGSGQWYIEKDTSGNLTFYKGVYGGSSTNFWSFLSDGSATMRPATIGANVTTQIAMGIPSSTQYGQVWIQYQSASVPGGADDQIVFRGVQNGVTDALPICRFQRTGVTMRKPITCMDGLTIANDLICGTTCIANFNTSTNQLRFRPGGGGFSCYFNVSQPASANRVVNFIDPGASNRTVLYTDAAQAATLGAITSAGTILFTGSSITLGDAAADTLNVGATSSFTAPATFGSLTATGPTIVLGDAAADTLTINATTTVTAPITFSSVSMGRATLTDVIDQLTLGGFGGTNTITLSAPTPSASRTVSFADPGAANRTLLYTDASQAATLGALSCTTLGASGAATLASVGCSSLAVTGAATIGTTLGVSGATTLASLGVTGAATVGTTLGVTGATTLATLGVTGAATVGTTLGVSGATTLASLGVTGASTLASLGVTGAATVGTTLGVSGAATLASLGVTGSATVGTTLGVTGTSTLAAVNCTTLSPSGLVTLSRVAGPQLMIPSGADPSTSEVWLGTDSAGTAQWRVLQASSTYGNKFILRSVLGGVASDQFTLTPTTAQITRPLGVGGAANTSYKIYVQGGASNFSDATVVPASTAKIANFSATYSTVYSANSDIGDAGRFIQLYNGQAGTTVNTQVAQSFHIIGTSTASRVINDLKVIRETGAQPNGAYVLTGRTSTTGSVTMRDYAYFGWNKSFISPGSGNPTTIGSQTAPTSGYQVAVGTAGGTTDGNLEVNGNILVRGNAVAPFTDSGSSTATFVANSDIADAQRFLRVTNSSTDTTAGVMSAMTFRVGPSGASPVECDLVVSRDGASTRGGFSMTSKDAASGTGRWTMMSMTPRLCYIAPNWAGYGTHIAGITLNSTYLPSTGYAVAVGTPGSYNADGALEVAGNTLVRGTLTTSSSLTVNGSSTLGDSTADVVTVAGPVSEPLFYRFGVASGATSNFATRRYDATQGCAKASSTDATQTIQVIWRVTIAEGTTRFNISGQDEIGGTGQGANVVGNTVHQWSASIKKSTTGLALIVASAGTLSIVGTVYASSKVISLTSTSGNDYDLMIAYTMSGISNTYDTEFTVTSWLNGRTDSLTAVSTYTVTPTA